MNFSPSNSADVLRDKIRSIEPSAHLVEARILRRVVRLDRRLPGFGLSLLQRRSYAIERDRLLSFVDRSELDLPPGLDLPRIVILLAKPEEDAFEAKESLELLFARYQRLLFHECVRVAILQRSVDEPSRTTWAAQRRREIGETEFAEIQAILSKDDNLFPSPSDYETYVEFAAVYLGLRYFSADDLGVFFPAIRHWPEIDRLVSRDVDHGPLYRRVLALVPQGPPYAEPTVSASVANSADAATRLAEASNDRLRTLKPISLAEFRRMQAQAESAAALGNGVKAALIHMRAALAGPEEHAAEAEGAAGVELRKVVQRLQRALELTDEETGAWSTAMAPLLAPAARGFWSNEARLLYDLQKVCIEVERGVFRLDLVEWVVTVGRRPIRRSLPLLQDALVIKHLRTGSRRIATARIGVEQRESLASRVEQALARVELRLRDTLRPVIHEVFEEVGLTAQNAPEKVAQRKIVEELLDGVVEHSYISMANLRDAISKNELKLPDVATIGDVLLGDRLLRADRKLDQKLDGIYRRAPIYQRWPQSISSLGFGTVFGRALTKYVALPYGGAYLTLEFLRHLTAGLFRDKPPESTGTAELAAGAGTVAASLPQVESASRPGWIFYSIVMLLGTWLLLLMHRPAFRAWNVAQLQRGWRVLRKLFVELPSRLVHSRLVRRILDSPVFGAARNYLIRPALVTILLAMLAMLGEIPFHRRTAFEAFLIVNLFLNSAGGRYITEITADFLVRLWHELTVRVLAYAVQWVMYIFQTLLVALERVVYMVDEWLLFRRGDNRVLQVFKALGGVIWFFVAYLVVFVFTLLVEPQINPIKHFPVVTVSHKLILPTGPLFVKHLTPYLGQVQANTLVWTTIWLVPGVFGFLVWELKENWRLYAANRSRVLRATLIGRHGETMVRLLRPGFHSGTLSKAYAALRRTARKNELLGGVRRVTAKQVAVQQVEQAVQWFVERELIAILEETNFLGDAVLRVTSVKAATNRIDVELACSKRPDAPARLTWEDLDGKLIARIDRLGWLEQLSAHDRTTFATAVDGLYRRSGVESAEGPLVNAMPDVIKWDTWVAFWSLTLGDLPEPIKSEP